jgi:hypothetical protein
MKKLALALMCLVSVAFFASCTKPVENPEPTIAVMTGDNFISGTIEEPTIINLNDENAINLKWGFHVESNAETKKQLASLKLTFEEIFNGETYVSDTTIDLTGMTSYDFSEFLFDQEERTILEEVTIKAVVTDADNKTNNATIALKLDMPEMPLPETPIEWIRKANNLIGNTEAEMAAMGLQWTGSYKDDIYATLRPVDGATLYVCEGDDFDEITTDVEKDKYFNDLAETAIAVDRYRNIKATASGTYNDMLAVVYDGETFLIHITYAKVDNLGSAGTQITITGEAK